MSAVSKTSSTGQVASTHSTPIALLSNLPFRRPGFAITLLLALVAAGLLLTFLVLALEWRGQPFLGVMLTPNMVVDGSEPVNADSPWTGLQAGLARGDQVVAVNGIQLMSSAQDYAMARTRLRDVMAGLKLGDRVSVTFLRSAVGNGVSHIGTVQCDAVADGFARCSTSYLVQPLPNSDFLAFFIIPYAAGVLTLAIGIMVLVLRPNQAAAQFVALMCIALAIFMGGGFDINNTYALTPVWLVSIAYLSGVLGSLIIHYPTKAAFAYKYAWVELLPMVGSSIVAILVLYRFFYPTNPRDFSGTWQAAMTVDILVVIAFVAVLLRRRSRTPFTNVRDQINAALIGLILVGLPMGLWMINLVTQTVMGSPILPLNSSTLMPFFILPSVGIAYGVLQYRNLDTEQIISRGITYGLMLVALITGYLLLVLGANFVTNELIGADNPILIAATIFIIATLFLPVRTRLQRRIDQIYFHVRTNYQERTEAYSQKLTTLTDLDDIFEVFQEEVNTSLQPEHTFIFLQDHQTGNYKAFGVGHASPPTDVTFDSASSMVSYLNETPADPIVYLEKDRPWPTALLPERTRINILKTLIIASLGSQDTLNGFIIFGRPRSGRGHYLYEEIRFIRNLTGQTAIAVERAVAMNTLERRVRELGILSNISQAVNFTVEFDDLLELISNQTERLLGATHFYIVLRHPAAPTKLYYAFFLENQERYQEKENKRWQMRLDLFSEVTRDGVPLIVKNYVEAMKERHSPIILEDPTLKAWMGVPLVAGKNTLGCLAVGTVNPDETYNDEQLRLFQNIGSLAATSLEKARLYAETNTRARQLSALNDISQQLASELHVERLLDLITRSAVDILEAEAGSLLLTVDDGSNDLEFKIAVGGSGQDLVGSRFPAGRGLVGEVASSSKPVIVNDAANDPRWGGDFEGSTFVTSAILAAPLIAQNRVTGVLEVLNKKNGGIFVDEDAELLATFAGQAAIALENARLFEMTDKQLSERVDELQVLERIDVELNRSLDLHKVAEITMRWAIANSGATAGILGLIVSDHSHLEVVARYGYDTADYPEGAEGMLWPLDRGIVRRVMRTRQADLVPDVKIDRDYIPSLRHSLSQITIPMLSAGEIHALLILETDREPRLSLVDMAFAQRLAEHASIAITNAQFYAEMQRANESKSEFVSFVAHELKTPMTSMKGFTDLLLGGITGSLNEQQKNFLRTIRSNIDRMNTLVSDLNDVTKLQVDKMRMEFSSLDFRMVITETLRPLTHQIEDKGQTLIVDLPSEMPLIQGDQSRLIQVLTNMVSNAYKYTPPDGTITIKGMIIEQEAANKKQQEQPQQMLHISVQDTGIGMSKDDLARLFTPYFRSDNPLAREQPGTGLGLTITQGIIQMHHGKIWVESELGKGTSFNFTLPLAANEEQPEEPELEDATQPIK
ncbi:MAG: GAF domain-containing protein [Anaerolineaceae bacterium]|nr:GAF domain-containing protein [Anaerolineaceae bacterium]